MKRNLKSLLIYKAFPKQVQKHIDCLVSRNSTKEDIIMDIYNKTCFFQAYYDGSIYGSYKTKEEAEASIMYNNFEKIEYSQEKEKQWDDFLNKCIILYR